MKTEKQLNIELKQNITVKSVFTRLSGILIELPKM